MPPRVLLSWSSGKDSAWALQVLRAHGAEVAGLLTTFNEAADRVAMHGVRRPLVEAQARSAGLPLWPVRLPWPCTNAVYEERMRAALARARAAGVTHVAFGDLFLEDIRDYRLRLLAGTGLEPLFPLWCTPAETPALARRMIAAGVRAVLACVDPRQLAPAFAGRRYDAALLAELPPGVDPCAERGEFHTFCYAGPMFSAEIPVDVGGHVTRDGFCFADLVPGDPVSGLCASCRWSRRVHTRRGAGFLRCGRADSDPRFARYPRLPVRACDGHEPVPPAQEGGMVK
jgi:diphthamide synthase (EF-2-diphthine--ammonia ligase)